MYVCVCVYDVVYGKQFNETVRMRSFKLWDCQDEICQILHEDKVCTVVTYDHGDNASSNFNLYLEGTAA